MCARARSCVHAPITDNRNENQKNHYKTVCSATTALKKARQAITQKQGYDCTDLGNWLRVVLWNKHHVEILELEIDALKVNSLHRLEGKDKRWLTRQAHEAVGCGRAKRRLFARHTVKAKIGEPGEVHVGMRSCVSVDAYVQHQ